jgi:branched-chain amino acid transport system ATP-binding protein
MGKTTLAVALSASLAMRSGWAVEFLSGEMSVEDNLLLGGFSRWRRGLRDQAQRMDEVFAIFPRLRERRPQMASTLSGGERQMLAIGRALMARPRLLLLDEPSLGLAPRMVDELLALARRIADTGTTAIIVTHDLEEADFFADVVIDIRSLTQPE